MDIYSLVTASGQFSIFEGNEEGIVFSVGWLLKMAAGG